MLNPRVSTYGESTLAHLFGSQAGRRCYAGSGRNGRFLVAMIPKLLNLVSEPREREPLTGGTPPLADIEE